MRFPQRRYGDADPSSHYLQATFRTTRGGVSENRYYLAEPKDLGLPVPSVRCSVVGCEGGVGLIELRSDRLVKDLELRARGSTDHFTDNYFDIDPGRVRLVLLQADDPARHLEKLSLRWLT